MTAQLDDLFQYNDAEFSLAGISDGNLFHPSLFGLSPAFVSTDCYAGYQAVFALSDSRLVLHALHVNLHTEAKGYERQAGPPIQGVAPTGPEREHDSFNNHYAGLEYQLDYTGGLLLADGFIEDLYDHMGFHPAWKYTHVIELLLTNGILDQAIDRSNRMADIRQKALDSTGEQDSPNKPTDDETREFVKRSFDRTYEP